MWKIRVNPTQPVTRLTRTHFSSAQNDPFDPQPNWPDLPVLPCLQNIRAIMPCWSCTGIRILFISSRSIFTMNKHLDYLAHGGSCIFVFIYTLQSYFNHDFYLTHIPYAFHYGVYDIFNLGSSSCSCLSVLCLPNPSNQPCMFSFNSNTCSVDTHYCALSSHHL